MGICSGFHVGGELPDRNREGMLNLAAFDMSNSYFGESFPCFDLNVDTNPVKYSPE